MRIAYITPGSGGSFYCQNCLRDIALVGAMRRAGHDAVVVPLYLPLFEAPGIERRSPVFFGALNVYLSQISRYFRKAPRWLEKFFDSGFVLRGIARIASSTRAKGLEDLTASMLRGKEGNQSGQLEEMVDWLEREFRPDVVHLSNALLSGMAGEIKRRLKVPVVCSLQDEDVWVEAFEPSRIEGIYLLISANAEHIDSFTVTSRYYLSRMKKILQLGEEKCTVVYPGLDFAEYGLSERPLDKPVVGFLSRMSEGLGLGRLVEAFCMLKSDKRFSGLQLHVAGGSTPDDRAFIKSIRQKIASYGFSGSFRIYDFETAAQRIEFLRTLTVMCVPVHGGEAFGMFIIEANACGVPVVEPDVGAFGEVLDITGGGVVYRDDGDSSLSRALQQLLFDRDKIVELGEKGREKVREKFSADFSAAAMLKLYSSLAEASQ